MTTNRTTQITVQGNEIALKRTKLADYISLTDIARSRDSENANELVRWIHWRAESEKLFRPARARIASNSGTSNPGF